MVLGLWLSEVSTPWGGVSLGIMGPVITVGWLVAIANAVNLIDGLDGLAGGVSLAAWRRSPPWPRHSMCRPSCC